MMEKVILLFCLAIVTVWFGIRFYSKNNEQIEDKADIKVIKNEINIIEAGGEEFLVSSMRDKKDGIIFFINPSVNEEAAGEAKLEKLKKHLKKTQNSLKQCSKDIRDLELRNKTYDVQINAYTKEYELKKNEGIDIGAAHGYGDKPLVENYYSDV